MVSVNKHKDLVHVFVDEFFFDPLTIENEVSTFLREVDRLCMTQRHTKKKDIISLPYLNVFMLNLMCG